MLSSSTSHKLPTRLTEFLSLSILERRSPFLGRTDQVGYFSSFFHENVKKKKNFFCKGKTTVALLLLKLHLCNSGSVKIDDHDLNLVKRKSLCERVSILTGEPLLFNESIRSNLLSLVPEEERNQISEKDLERVCSLVGLDKDIEEKMERGMDSVIGEVGSKLSAGQRQKLVFARILLRKPSILILDEFDSHLDIYHKQMFASVLREHFKEVTCLFVTHSREMLSAADKIILLENGRIVSQGSYQEIVKNPNSTFNSLFY